MGQDGTRQVFYAQSELEGKGENDELELMLPATDPHSVVAVNSGVRIAEILLNRCNVLDLDSKGEGDEGAARFSGKRLKRRWKA